jgi:TonB family protein
MNYADDSCVLKRVFGEGEQEIYLELRRFSPESGFQITLMGKKLSRPGAPIKYRFEPAAQWQDAPYSFYGRMPDGLDGYVFSGWVLPDPKPEKESPPTGEIDPQIEVAATKAFTVSSGFSVSGPFAQDVTLKTGPMLPPHRAMQNCLDQMLVRWGIDVSAHKTLTRRAVPRNMKSMVLNMQQDYPKHMLLQGKSGLIRVRVSVNEAGKVTDCHIQLKISDREFERVACSRVQSARFNPALDKDGHPIASYWNTAIAYQVD